MGVYAGELFPTLFGCVLGVSLYLLAGSVSKDKEKGLSRISKAANSALSSPWQVWPCRVEEAAIKGAKLLILLGPDGAVARAFVSNMPDEAWISMTDGRGLVWFAGDMRFGGIAALPGGSPIWWAHSPQANATLTASSNHQQRIEEEFTRQAISYVFSEWL
ncbi:hypothetical protein [Streptomyces sp. NPDC018352]|uniref:hypothetical protein n=1 Tax=Streptomyces sp. NPDC018352 TaxID=3157194 RepID=UPI0033D00841